MTARTGLMAQLDEGATDTGVYWLELISTPELSACGQDAIQALIDYWGEVLAKTTDPAVANDARRNIRLLEELKPYAPKLCYLPLDRRRKKQPHFAHLYRSAGIMYYPGQRYDGWRHWHQADFVSDNGTTVFILYQGNETPVPSDSWRIVTLEEFTILEGNATFFRQYMLASAEGLSVAQRHEVPQQTAGQD